MDLQSMPVDILEHILLRSLDSPSCLIHASSTCKLWRQIIADTVFLQRFRSLHEPPVVGSYHYTLPSHSPPRFEPSPSTTIDSRHLSLDFLPVNSTLRGGRWKIWDSRGSLLLLGYTSDRDGFFNRDMFICEPLTRQHEKIVPPTTASPRKSYHEHEAFLLDGAEPGEISMSNFRLLYMDQINHIVSIFTSGGSWRKLSIDDVNLGSICMEHLGSAAGSMYWHAERIKTVYALDQSSTDAGFSSSLLPDDEDPLVVSSKFAVTGRDGRARILFLKFYDNLKIFARQEGSRGSSDWVLEKSIQLSAAMLGVPKYKECIVSALSAETIGTVQIVVFTGQIGGEVLPAINLDIETKQLVRTTYVGPGHPIKLPWPPSLHACTDHA